MVFRERRKVVDEEVKWVTSSQKHNHFWFRKFVLIFLSDGLGAISSFENLLLSVSYLEVAV